VSFPYTLPSGLIAKGVANNGKGSYIQTSIADSDPAMKYNPAITDDAAKAHFSAAELAEAQKVIVRFMAEEVIDSTIKGGTDIDGWWAKHKDQIHPVDQTGTLAKLKAGEEVLDRQLWMTKEDGLSFDYGAERPRIASRTITPERLYYVQGNGLEGIKFDTRVAYTTSVIKKTAAKTVKYPTSTYGSMSYAVAKDPADGKWKIAGYNTDIKTTG
jgi:hypothetical protein